MTEGPCEIIARVNKGGLQNLRFEDFSISSLPTKILSTWSRVLLEKLTLAQVDNKFSAFYGILRFITMFSEPATDQTPQPYGSSPHCQTQSLLDPFQLSKTYLKWNLDITRLQWRISMVLRM
jgi:hypothetical protein